MFKKSAVLEIISKNRETMFQAELATALNEAGLTAKNGAPWTQRSVSAFMCANKMGYYKRGPKKVVKKEKPESTELLSSIQNILSLKISSKLKAQVIAELV